MGTNKLSNYERLVNESPIFKQASTLPEQALNAQTFDDLLDELKVIQSKYTRSLKIVIMGEVKAGKSTLLNALLNTEVAPTDVTETTATVMEITYGHEERGTVHYSTGEDKSFSIDDLYLELHSHKDDRSYFETVTSVKVTLPNPHLNQYHIVDTPGLGTITDANEQVTINYIQEADVVLWVLNVHHLGQLDINDYIEKVARYGKPIYAVLNRIDEIDEDVESLEEYVYESLESSIRKVIGLSGYEAQMALQESDEERLKQSRFPLLTAEFDRLRENAETVLDESIYTSLDSFLERYTVLHQATLRRMHFMQENTSKRVLELQDFHKQLMMQIGQNLHSWARHHLLEGNKQILLSEAKKISAFRSSTDQKVLMDKLVEVVSTEQLQEQLKQKVSEINTLFEAKWTQFIKDFTRKLAEDQLAFEQEQLNGIHHQFTEGQKFVGHQLQLSFGEQLIPATFQGAAVGTVSGAALATYAAVLGPAASSITMGAAFAAFIPPMAILGGAIAGAALYFNSNKKKLETANQIEDAIQSIRTTIDETVIPKIEDGFATRSTDIIHSIEEQLHHYQFANLSAYEVTNFIHELDGYITRLETVNLSKSRILA